MTKKKPTIEELLAEAWRQGALAGLMGYHSEPMPSNPYVGVTRVQHPSGTAWLNSKGEVLAVE